MSSTHNPEPSPPSVLMHYSHQLKAQTEALHSRLQTSLVETKEKQERLVELLGRAEKRVKVQEGKIGEVMGKVEKEGKWEFFYFI